MDGKKLKKRRLDLKLTLQDVADACGVSRACVLKWESGETGSIKTSTIPKLARILKVENEFFIDNSNVGAISLEDLGETELEIVKLLKCMNFNKKLNVYQYCLNIIKEDK